MLFGELDDELDDDSWDEFERIGGFSRAEEVFEDVIMCGSCGEKVVVSGGIWAHRLRTASRDVEGNALGWRCDPCADAVEQGRDCW